MNVLSPQIAQTKQYRDQLINWLSSMMPGGELPTPPGMSRNALVDPGTWQGAGNRLLDMMIPQPEDTLIAPAELRPNFRTPGQIQALRKMMAEEQRARGPLNTSLSVPESIAEIFPNKNYTQSDPIDQILRGSWYHGMSEKARMNAGIDRDISIKNFIDSPQYHDIVAQKLGFENFADYAQKQSDAYVKNTGLPAPGPNQLLQLLFNQSKSDSNGLQKAFETGFPKSAHDAASISNKLGEPAGVSLSLNPTVSGKFSADENIHRVMPLSGGPPTQRTVNLMAPEGRNALNDAYDAVANQELMKYPAILRMDLQSNTGLEPPQLLQKYLSSMDKGVGPFNQQLSNQLQNQGYRGILYNPQRWNEYEMLMLDPKYALPLDYRTMQDYKPERFSQIHRNNQYETPIGPTPGAQQGLNALQEVMAANHSRLGDIYNERPWWERLTEPVKNALLRDNPMAEAIIQKLKGGK